MNELVISVLCLLFIEPSCAGVIRDAYNGDRQKLIHEESLQTVGGKLELNENDLIVNDILMKMKEKEIEQTFKDPKFFNFSRHYFSYKDDINKSEVYQFIRRMPKGAALHVHSSLMLPADCLIELTYENHLYACFSNDDLKLHFSYSQPLQPCPGNWTLLSDLRNASGDITAFDANLKKYFTLDPDDRIGFHSDINTVWQKFNQVAKTIKSLILYRPVREKFFYRALKTFYDDNVMYIEVRSGLSQLYELNGTQHDKIYSMELFDRVLKNFMKDHPDFVGVKLIMTRMRSVNITQLQEAIDLARKVKREFPHIFAGFDLVGQEDLGKPLSEFLPVLLEAKDDIDYYFHGGETNWYGTPADENLFDAVLLGSKRIGHAYALMKHPSLIMAVAYRGIALEVNVISNAVLSLVQDMRNHPLASYLALGLPVVLSSDDPGVWGAQPLSDDFYLAYTAIASKHSDLRLLKQLAINSIKYSALDELGKTRLYEVFNSRWDKFIKEVIDERS